MGAAVGWISHWKIIEKKPKAVFWGSAVHGRFRNSRILRLTTKGDKLNMVSIKDVAKGSWCFGHYGISGGKWA